MYISDWQFANFSLQKQFSESFWLCICTWYSISLQLHKVGKSACLIARRASYNATAPMRTFEHYEIKGCSCSHIMLLS